MQRTIHVWILIGIVCGWSLAAGDSAFGQRRQGRPGAKPGEVITPPDRSERWRNRLQVSHVAPEFTLPLLPQHDAATGTSTASISRSEDADRTVSLSDLRREQPVVLIFGSFTCPPFRRQLERVNDVYEEFQGRAEFLFVYVREAHPGSILSVIDPRGEETLLKIPQPKDLSTRTKTAAICQRTVELDLPIAIDTIDNKVGRAYAGWPNRMVVVGTNGRILFATDPSPRGTDAQRLRTWLAENLSNHDS